MMEGENLWVILWASYAHYGIHTHTLIIMMMIKAPQTLLSKKKAWGKKRREVRNGWRHHIAANREKAWTKLLEKKSHCWCSETWASYVKALRSWVHPLSRIPWAISQCNIVKAIQPVASHSKQSHTERDHKVAAWEATSPFQPFFSVQVSATAREAVNFTLAMQLSGYTHTLWHPQHLSSEIGCLGFLCSHIDAAWGHFYLGGSSATSCFVMCCLATFTSCTFSWADSSSPYLRELLPQV